MSEVPIIQQSQMELNPTTIEALWQRFRKKITGFTDFDSPGSAFQDRETTYKRKMLQKFQQELGREKLSDLVAKGQGLNASREVARLLTGNIVNFRSWNATLGDSDEVICDVVRQFLIATSRPYTGQDSTKDLFNTLFRHKLKPNWDALSTLLWALEPKEYFPIKISYYRDLSKELKYELPSGGPDATNLNSLIAFGRAFWKALEPQKPHDWVDVQSFIWCVCPDKLGAPFGDIFSSREEADACFDLLQATFQRLGVEAADAERDKRICLSLSRRAGEGVRLRLNFGNWAILTFLNKSVGENRAQYACRLDKLPATSPRIENSKGFAEKIDDHTFDLATGPIANLLDPQSIERTAFEEALKEVARHFKGWKAGTFQAAHKPEVLQMVFDVQIREKLLREGIKLNTQGYWIFQGNPAQFDIDQYLRTRSVICWQTRQHTDRVKAGDKVLIWRSGQNGGVLAECVVDVAPSPSIEEDAPELYRIPLDPEDSVPRCKLKITNQFSDKPITRESVAAVLPDLKIIKSPQGTNFPITESEYSTILALQATPLSTDSISSNMPPDNSTTRLPTARNIILFGPPGTGKTYTIRTRYMELFTEREVVLTEEEEAAALVKNLAWWEVIALALLGAEGNRASVTQLLSHPLVQARLRRAANANPRATLWSSLQSHTKVDCPHVKYAKRIEPLLFWREESPIWSLDATIADAEVPELRQILNGFRSHENTVTPVARRYRFTTFHQSFSYEDFIEGIKPEMEERDDGQIAYEIRDGVFKDLCLEAAANPAKPYALFIDEINRGNVASIFGELITLIEEDKRLGAPNELKALPPYSRDEFGVPANLYIIGTMNTADRSVEALDTALRRRFTFEEMRPNPNLITNPVGLNVDLKSLFETINARIEQLLDHDHCIGHAYFMEIKNLDDLRRVFANKILPLLREYFYGNPAKVGMVLGEPFVFRIAERVPFAPGTWGVDDLDEKEVYQFADISGLSTEDFASIYAKAGTGV